jgi:hypothetical protein
MNSSSCTLDAEWVVKANYARALGVKFKSINRISCANIDFYFSGLT